MNIFILSMVLKDCARWHFDSHCIKMILEMTQLLSTSWHVLDEQEANRLKAAGKIYAKTHQNHPCAVWTRAHLNNFTFVSNLALALCDEWRDRWNHPAEKKHACESIIRYVLENPPPSIPKYRIAKTDQNCHGLTLPLPQAMAEECRVTPEAKSVDACVQAYRNFYQSKHKSHLVKWTRAASSASATVAGEKGAVQRVKLPKPEWWGKKTPFVRKSSSVSTSAKKQRKFRGY